VAAHWGLDALAQFGQPACHQGLQLCGGIVPVLRSACPKGRLRQQPNSIPHKADLIAFETVITMPLEERACMALLIQSLRPACLTQPLRVQHRQAVAQDWCENTCDSLSPSVQRVRQDH
jgi:hypothetical protein